MAARRKKTLCEEHFPDGWEGIDKQHEGVKVTGVGCEHGTYTRTETEPKDPQDPPKDPDPDGDEGDGGGQGDGSDKDGGK